VNTRRKRDNKNERNIYKKRQVFKPRLKLLGLRVAEKAIALPVARWRELELPVGMASRRGIAEPRLTGSQWTVALKRKSDAMRHIQYILATIRLEVT